MLLLRHRACDGRGPRRSPAVELRRLHQPPCRSLRAWPVTDWQKDVPPRDEKPGPGKWLNSQQEFSPVILEVARASDYASFAAFQNAILANPLTWKDRRLDYS